VLLNVALRGLVFEFLLRRFFGEVASSTQSFARFGINFVVTAIEMIDAGAAGPLVNPICLVALVLGATIIST